VGQHAEIAEKIVTIDFAAFCYKVSDGDLSSETGGPPPAKAPSTKLRP